MISFIGLQEILGWIGWIGWIERHRCTFPTVSLWLGRQDKQALNGIGFAMRQMGGMIKPTTIISVDGDTVKLETKSTFKNTEISFKLNQEFDEHTADDRKAKSLITVEGNKMVHIQKWEGKETSLVREVTDDTLLLTLTMEDVVSTRHYSKTE
ncbi:hypothetical protein NHX12_023516 [Muraenolepis orangiensis]|uniref:Cellular retinoic acid-binding protein 1 n=1 Tax=Muraenolepis orangiensis TaxID=630683 RepID=A0A9Q0ENS4_9TELE|nr:hypothetical protein NHX12_023516 [Muraenolepis orangiensis]